MSKTIPKLRFKEFKDKWSTKLISEVLEVIDCKHRTPEYVEEGVPVVSPGTIRWGEIDLVTPMKRVTEHDYESLMDHCFPKKGDIVFSRNQSIGVASILLKKEKFVLGQDTVLMQAKEIDPVFNYFNLQTISVQSQISKLSGGSTFARINLGDLRKLRIVVAENKIEQQKIASFLSAVDEKIQQLTRKKELLEQYKKGVMQQLFSGKLRFKDQKGKAYPKWEEKRLGEISNKKSSNIAANSIEENTGVYKIYGASGLLKYIDFYNESEPFISIVKDGAGVGRTLLCDANSSVLGTLDIIKPNTKVDLYFLYSVLNNIDFTKYSIGSTIPHIYFKDYSKERINIPCIEEQQKIASFLVALDSKVENVANK